MLSWHPRITEPRFGCSGWPDSRLTRSGLPQYTSVIYVCRAKGIFFLCNEMNEIDVPRNAFGHTIRTGPLIYVYRVDTGNQPLAKAHISSRSNIDVPTVYVVG